MTNIIADIADIGKIIDTVASEVATVIGQTATKDISEFWGFVTGSNEQSTSYVGHTISNVAGQWDKDLGRLIMQPLLEGTMGIDYSTLQQQSDGAINTLEGAVGFSLMLDAITEGLDGIIKTILGDRAPEFILDTIRKVPQAVGMEYFLGITLANTFELAVGTPLEEAINEQVLPARVDIQTLRQALRQHKITIDEADQYRAKLGYRPEDWTLITSLGSNLLTTGDLQTLYEYGIINTDTFNSYLQAQGYTDEDIAYLAQIYLMKSETSGGQVYRSVARQAYLESMISSDQFSAILKEANVPDGSITLELAALDLQKQIGVSKIPVGDIKTAYDNGDIDADEVKSQLIEHGYNASDTQLIMTDWGVGTSIIKPNTTAKKIIQYYKSGVINESTAVQALVNIGVSIDTATAMVSYGQGTGTGYLHTLSPSTVLSAYKDGVIGLDDAKVLLENLGMSSDDINYSIGVAQYQIAHKRVPKGATKNITVADVKDALKYGLATPAWAIRELEALGYSSDDANLIVAIEMTDLSGNVPNGWVTLN